MSDLTKILAQLEHGDPQATEKLLPLVYDELRKLAAAKLAQEKPGQTLQATALVHEAYLRLIGGEGASSQAPVASDEGLAAGHRPLVTGHWHSRGHFFAAAAEAMRRILLNRARDKQRVKRGGGQQRVDLDQIEIALDTDNDQLIALDAALTQLAIEDPDAARLVNLRFFAGLPLRDVAATLGLSQRTAERQWAYARAWLYAYLRRHDALDSV